MAGKEGESLQRDERAARLWELLATWRTRHTRTKQGAFLRLVSCG